MRPRLERIDTLKPPPRWFILAYLAWAALILAVHLVNSFSEREFIICTLRRVTGVPCPTCGSTRAVEAALRGDLPAAVFYNPLVVGILVVGGVVMALRFVAKRRLVLGLSKQERVAAWLMMLVVVGLNWWHVIAYHAG